MRPEEIRSHVVRRPFQPFRVFISDGSSYTVRHPELIYVGRREAVIAVALGEGDIPEQSAYCDPLHITRIEPLPGNGRRARKKPPK